MSTEKTKRRERKKMFNIRLTEAEHAMLELRAKANLCSMSTLVRQTLLRGSMSDPF